MKSFSTLLLTITAVLVLNSCNKEQYRTSRKYQLSEKDKQSQDYLTSEANKVIDKSDKEREKRERKALKERNKQIQKEKQIAEAEAAKEDKKKEKKKVRVNTGEFKFY